MELKILSHLQALLQEATQSLPGVHWRRMFGCDAVFADETIFGMVWKHGRIALKLPETDAFRQLVNLPGAGPWAAGDRTMASWVFVPETFHDDIESLGLWTKRAYHMAMATPKAIKKGKTAPKKISSS